MKAIIPWHKIGIAAITVLSFSVLAAVLWWMPRLLQYGPVNPSLSPQQILKYSEWAMIPSHSDQWQRVVVPVIKKNQSFRAFIQSYPNSSSPLQIYQDNEKISELIVNPGPKVRFTHEIEFRARSTSPITILYFGPSTSRLWLSQLEQQTLVLTALLAIGGALVLANGMMSLVVFRSSQFILTSTGAILLTLPVLSPEFRWAALTALVALQLPIHSFLRGSVAFAAIAACSFIQVELLPILTIALALPLFGLLFSQSQPHWHWARTSQLIILLCFCADAFPTPQFNPFALIILAITFLLVTLADQSLWLTRPLRKQANHKRQFKDRTSLLQRIDQLENKNKLLQEKSTTDHLTGLRNRQFFNERYRIEVARSARQLHPLTLLILDLDHFKKINDTHGHPVGDHVLQEVAKRIYFSLKRPTDTLCRYGGEEFAVLLPETNENGAAFVAERVIEAVRNKPIACGELSLSITMSIGGATLIQRQGMVEMELLIRADKALYRAKELGRNQYQAAQTMPPPLSVANEAR